MYRISKIPTIDTCPIWPEFPAEQGAREHGTWSSYRYQSPRAGGCYAIAHEEVEMLRRDADNPVNDQVRARLTTMLIEMRKQGVMCPQVTAKLIQRAADGDDMLVKHRVDRLLRYLGEKTLSVGARVYLTRESHEKPEDSVVLMDARAISESVHTIEIDFLISSMEKYGYVENEQTGNGNETLVTAEGHARIAELATSTDSAQAFVAMWFDPSMNEVYERAIKPAIEGAGYDAFIINRHDFTGKIEDEIIAQIRQSRFIVANFTHAPDATVRGSVYYEAGFAHGLSIPVIFTAREGSELHFDTAHYNHIMWMPDDLPMLREGIRNRILAVTELGPGPRARGG